MATLIILKKVGDFDTKGFLGKEMQTLLPEVRKRFQDTFDLFHELNEYAQQTKYRINIGRYDQRVLTACLFARILNGAQAAYLLLSYGLCMDARVVLRSILEALFILRNLVKEPGFAKAYVGADEWKRFKQIKSAKNSGHFVPENLVDHLEKRVKEKRLSKLLIKTVADNVDMRLHYEGLYSRLSDDSHVAAHTLDAFVPSQRHGVRGRIDCTPQFAYIPGNLLIGSDILLRSLSFLDDLFGLKIETELQEFRKRLATMAKKYTHVEGLPRLSTS